MNLPPFAVTWDYRCPFARNAHEHLIAALEADAPWSVTFVPFSLSQVHVGDGEDDVWDDPGKARELLALAAGVVVRDRHPERFLAAHRALFAARHDDGRDIRQRAVVRDVLDDAAVPGDDVLAEIDAGWPIVELRRAYEDAVTTHDVFGVPTFIVDGRAAFARLMTRPGGDGALATRTIGGVVGVMTAQPEINELKYTTVDR